MAFGLKGRDVADAIKHLATLQNNGLALEMIREATTSCLHWAGILEQLLKKDTIGSLFIRGTETLGLRHLNKIREELKEGKAVLGSLRLLDGDNHAFCIEPRGSKARILHAWQDGHTVRAERAMPIDELTDDLIGLWIFDHGGEEKHLENVFKRLFGADHAPLDLHRAPVRGRISFEGLKSGVPLRPLDEPGSRQRLSSIFSGMSEYWSPRPSRLSGMEDWRSFRCSRLSVMSDQLAPPPRCSRLSVMSDQSAPPPRCSRLSVMSDQSAHPPRCSRLSVMSDQLAPPPRCSRLSVMSDQLAPPPRCSRLSVMSDQSAHPSGSKPVSGQAGMIRSGTVVGAALGFVFGVGGVLVSGERDTKEVMLAGAKSALGGAASGGVAAAAAKMLNPAFSSIGFSVVRANILSGVAFMSVFAVWDVVEWRMHRITEVQLRQRMAEGLAGGAGGIGGGVAAGVGFGLWLGPIGAAVGALVGGIVGGIGGAFAGKAIDGAIWDASEDSVMNMYEFFGWHNVRRNTRPVKTAEQMEKAYDKKLGSKPSKIKEKDWDKICQASVVVLLQAMYPVFMEVMKMADNLQKNSSGAVSAIGTEIYQSIMEEEEELVPSKTVG